MAESELWDKPVAGSRLPLLFARRKKIETNFRSLWTGASLVATSPLSSSRQQTGIDWLIFLSMLMAWWDWSMFKSTPSHFPLFDSMDWTFHSFIANQYYHRHLQAVERALHSNYGVNRRVSCYAGSVIFLVKKCFLSCWDPFNIITRMIFGILGIKD